jgi:hypothetical protein
MCGGGSWKREVVSDHKFYFVDVHDYKDESFATRIKYLWLYLVVLKDFLVYVSDIFTAVTMLVAGGGLSTEIIDRCGKDGCIAVPFKVTRPLFISCIGFSFLLLAYESRKTQRIIKSQDISYAFTNVMAHNYYSLRDYDYFCFFQYISRVSDGKTSEWQDDVILFVFFAFKTWKRLLLADGPRQAINALTLYAIYLSKKREAGPWWDVPRYFRGNSISLNVLTVTTFFTVLVFAGSLVLLIIASILYPPVLCKIQGNLKEYVCHRVDVRIDLAIKRRTANRAAQQTKNQLGGPQPTLPGIKVSDFEQANQPTLPEIKTNYFESYPPTSREYYAGPPSPQEVYPHYFDPLHQNASHQTLPVYHSDDPVPYPPNYDDKFPPTYVPPGR